MDSSVDLRCASCEKVITYISPRSAVHLCRARIPSKLSLFPGSIHADAKIRSKSLHCALPHLTSVPFSMFMLRPCGSGSVALARHSSRVAKLLNTSSQLLPADGLLEEERNPDYDPRRFYPARVGETIQRYEIISKLGWGTGSTVWLAKDVKRFVQWPSQQFGNNRSIAGRGNRTDTWRSKSPTALKEIVDRRTTSLRCRSILLGYGRNMKVAITLD